MLSNQGPAADAQLLERVRRGVLRPGLRRVAQGRGAGPRAPLAESAGQQSYSERDSCRCRRALSLAASSGSSSYNLQPSLDENSPKYEDLHLHAWKIQHCFLLQ